MTAQTADRRLIDLSHTVEDGMTTYPGLPEPRIKDVLSREASRERYAPGTEFLIGEILLCGNTGTYVDSPFHRYPDGADLAALDLARLADLPGVLVDATGREERGIGPEAFAGLDVGGKAVVVRTDWSRHWRTEAYANGHPYLTQAAADHLVAAGAALVGIDSLNIDSTKTGERPVHSTLLAAGIPICEHLTNLGALPADAFRFSAVPVKVAGFGTFPVRAWASVSAPDQ
jgi:kynurenine formamidase